MGNVERYCLRIETLILLLISRLETGCYTTSCATRKRLEYLEIAYISGQALDRSRRCQLRDFFLANKDKIRDKLKFYMGTHDLKARYQRSSQSDGDYSFNCAFQPRENNGPDRYMPDMNTSAPPPIPTHDSRRPRPSLPRLEDETSHGPRSIEIENCFPLCFLRLQSLVID